MRALIKIYFRMAQKVDYERNIKEIRTDIFMKGSSLADHTLQCSSLIRKSSVVVDESVKADMHAKHPLPREHDDRDMDA